MGTQLAAILHLALLAFRWIGLIVLTIASMGILISEAVKNKLSPSRVFAVAGSAILAAFLFWILPTVVNHVWIDSDHIVRDQPIGGYR